MQETSKVVVKLFDEMSEREQGETGRACCWAGTMMVYGRSLQVSAMRQLGRFLQDGKEPAWRDLASTNQAVIGS